MDQTESDLLSENNRLLRKLSFYLAVVAWILIFRFLGALIVLFFGTPPPLLGGY